MDTASTAGDVLMNSIILLGISPAQASREYGCEFNRSMFVQANQKGLNAVMHLLFERIRGKELFKKDIKGAWPIKDTVQQRDFNKLIHRLVTEVTDQGVATKHLAANLSHSFRQVCGLRLTALLCYLAAHALTQDRALRVMDFNYVLQELPANHLAIDSIYKSVRAQATTERKKLTTALMETAQSQASWMAAADRLGAEYCDTLREMTELCEEDAAKPPESALAHSEIDGSPKVVHDGPAYSAGPCEAAVHVDALWTAMQQCVDRQRQLQEVLMPVLAQAAHPHNLDGAALQPAAATGQPEAGAQPSMAAVVQLPALLQAWEGLIQAYLPALPEHAEVERLQSQHRPITPLLEQDQQTQMASITQQHKSRLQSQQQLSIALHELRTTAVAHKQALHGRINGAFRLAPKLDLAPDSCAKDLIRASYPSPREAEGNPAVKETGLLHDDRIDLAFLPKPLQNAGGLLKKTDPFPSDAHPLLVSAVGLEAGLSQAAYQTQFAGSHQPLKPFAANTGAQVLEPSGVHSQSDCAFMAEDADAPAGVGNVKIAARAAAKDKLEVAGHGHNNGMEEVSTNPKVTGAAVPMSVLPVSAAPRRLSFSGTTPQVGAAAASSPVPSSTTEAMEEDKPDQPTDPLSVADIMARVQRLKASS